MNDVCIHCTIPNRDKICALKTCHQPFQNKSILKCLTEIFHVPSFSLDCMQKLILMNKKYQKKNK